MELEIRALIKALNPEMPVNFGRNPEGTAYPSAVINLTSSTNGHSHDGPDRLKTSRVQIDVYATSYDDLVRVRDVIRSGLDGYRGDAIEHAFLDNISQTFADGKHRAMMTFFVNYG